MKMQNINELRASDLILLANRNNQGQTTDMPGQADQEVVQRFLRKLISLWLLMATTTPVSS